ncbi:uncharacterized protein LOC105635700 [Jatropha curcas]|nr:uncharacterized protein LOC105635700 [Jatropha curcas]XP_020535590.1 uncharacterized protein LOC105635700 [Jatropha curcas]XP_020535594.1 uncharacterized protein LOC105635700 [Jatropha curcas]XP_037494939.1 uncharacterized protein LOC105635700 [Jatropha curcas]
MLLVKSLSVISNSHLCGLLLIPKQPICFSVFCSFSTLAKTSKSPNPALFDYLIKNLKFSETKALSLSTRTGYSGIKSVENPIFVVRFLQNLGFSHSNIQSTINGAPQIIFANVDKTLKPKIDLFQDLGLVGNDLVKFISKNSILLTTSLEKKLVPRIKILQKILLNDENNKDLVKVISRCNWIICSKPESVLLSNIAFLQSCGIIGSQLSKLLIRSPRLFIMRESKVRDLVSRALNMGFSVDSRMLVHALYSVVGVNEGTFERKFGILKSFGFSKHEYLEMFRKAPHLPRTSEEKLKLGIDFFLNTVKFKKEVLVYTPTLLLHSMENRVIPRYKVLEILKSKKLLKKDPSFMNVLHLTDEEFLERFISRFPNEAEELLVAYKGHTLDSSSVEEKC